MSRCLWPCALSLIIGGTGGAAIGISIEFRRTQDMPVERALDLIGSGDLSPEQRLLVAAALRRLGLAAVIRLVEMADEATLAGEEARNALRQIREAIR